MEKFHILFIDAYDSFANNIISLLETHLPVAVSTIKIDHKAPFPGPEDDFAAYCARFHAVVLGPGPGDVRNRADVGLFEQVWAHRDSVRPVLGICLGFQSLVLRYGGSITRRRDGPKHGMIRAMHHKNSDIFQGLPAAIGTVLYHSLEARLSPGNSDLETLAWDTSDVADILMAVKHRTLPYHGLQNHPESICSSQHARQVVVNWWSSVLSWWQDRRPDCPVPMLPEPLRSKRRPLKQVRSSTIPLGGLDLATIVSRLGLTSLDMVVLDSENHQRARVGEFSIIGLKDSIITSMADVLTGLPEYTGGNSAIPFWGGYIGFIPYETCLDTIGLAADRSHVLFASITRSIVLAHTQRSLTIQSLRADDEWVALTELLLLQKSPSQYPLTGSILKSISLPDEGAYKAKVAQSKALIDAGEAYEICLTDQACVEVESEQDLWSLYLRLRRLNPAPFSAFVQLAETTILSSSPERFLSWTRPDDQGVSTCQFRPIKGTVSRESSKMNLQTATEILLTPKEKAENLMIADLIRHDLHGVAGSGNVRVTQLMAVEEYKTVFQLVSVIEGEVSSPRTGVDVLAASLPPGSMTGAPKIRSCQLLQGLEQRDRGAYSGVLGYLDVGGGGDFSVIIRTAVREAEVHSNISGKWHIGAGGAITALSTEDGEFAEMMTKLRSTLQLFQA